MTVDPGLDLLSVASRFSDLVGQNLYTLQLPVDGELINGNDVLLVDMEAGQAVLDYFRGTAPSAPPTTAVSTTAVSTTIG